MQPTPEISMWAVAGIMITVGCMVPAVAMLALALWDWVLNTAWKDTETDSQNSEG
jgi:hypothetical protein